MKGTIFIWETSSGRLLKYWTAHYKVRLYPLNRLTHKFSPHQITPNLANKHLIAKFFFPFKNNFQIKIGLNWIAANLSE